MENYLICIKKRFEYYKTLGDKTFEQLHDDGLFWQYNHESNSIAMIVRHVAGNMISRWTGFFTTDGEKPGRNRDKEFEPISTSRPELFNKWTAGWDCLFKALDSIKADDWQKEIYIRNEPHTVVDAINRQLAHVAYHVGQIVFIGKMIAGSNWASLSIPKGKSGAFNTEKFAERRKKG